MLADMAFRIVSHIVNLTPMCDTLAIEVGFGTALAKRVSHVRKPERMPSQRRSEQVVNEQIAPTKWLEFMGLGDHCASAVGMNVHSPRIQVVSLRSTKFVKPVTSSQRVLGELLGSHRTVGEDRI
jgi:hypothetical protein